MNEVAAQPSNPTQVAEPHASRVVKVINLIAVALPFAALLLTIAVTWGWGVDGHSLAVFGVMYILTAVGVTLGYHRLFTHRSFQTFAPVRATLAVLGSMAAEGPVLYWVAVHRRHHQHADHEDDPHSPHLHGKGLVAMGRGLWHAHAGWLFGATPPNLPHYVGDLRRDPMVLRVSKLFPLWVAVGLILPAIVCGLLTQSWGGVLLGFLWGGLVRIFFVHHVTWSINSVCHFWGYQTFKGDDESRNNPLFGVLGLGEGWHNNHHAFPTSARHGLRWWEFDATYLFIRLMEQCGLAWKVRRPTAAAILAKRASEVPTSPSRHVD